MKLIITTNTDFKFELKIQTKTEAEKGGIYNKQIIDKTYYKVDSPFCNTWFNSIDKMTEFFNNIYLYKNVISK